MSDLSITHSLPRISPAEAVAAILADIPMIDVRAPVEFSAGSFPTAVNLPLLDNLEREKVGICYKEKGNAAAVQLGHQLISGQRKVDLIKSWQRQISARPDTILFCFRGGQRSRISQQWLHEQGITIPIIEGGYKALRRYLLEQLTYIISAHPLVTIGGRTGVRKTALIERIDFGIDLERHANHRGSAFGRRATPQPTPINFEHHLILEMITKHRLNPEATLFFEDEGQNIGSLSVPLPLREALAESPIWLLEDTLEHRAREICQAYVTEPALQYIEVHGTQHGLALHQAALLEALSRIQKRLGHDRHRKTLESMQTALAQTHCNRTDTIPNDFSSHLDWITLLLADYYDPMYDYQLTKKAQRVERQGDWHALSEAAAL